MCSLLAQIKISREVADAAYDMMWGLLHPDAAFKWQSPGQIVIHMRQYMKEKEEELTQAHAEAEILRTENVGLRDELENGLDGHARAEQNIVIGYLVAKNEKLQGLIYKTEWSGIACHETYDEDGTTRRHPTCPKCGGGSPDGHESYCVYTYAYAAGYLTSNKEERATAVQRLEEDNARLRKEAEALRETEEVQP